MDDEYFEQWAATLILHRDEAFLPGEFVPKGYAEGLRERVADDEEEAA